MAKYPGSFILNEYGTTKELAQSYGVSERTIYRWKNKARAEEGITTKSKKPSLKQIAKFKGTRKELAAKYGISERTAYRWLNKARQEGAEVSRKNTTRYPGLGADLEGKLKDVAQKYGVSERTISRWKKRQQVEKQDLEEVLSPDNIPEEFQPAIEQAENPIEEFEEPVNEFEEDISDLEENISKETLDNLKGISDILDSEDLLVDGSIFHDLTTKEKLQYLDAYIQYQYDLDEHQFYNEAEHQMDFSPDFLSTINIWGEEFEDWAQKQFDYSMFEV